MSQTTESTWDAWDRLVTVTEYATEGGSATQVVHYFYDAENRWIGKVIDSNGDGVMDRQIRFAYDGYRIVLQFDASSPLPVGEGQGEGGKGERGNGEGGEVTAANLSHRYLWGPAVDQILADEQLAPADSSLNPEPRTLNPSSVVWPLADHLGTARDLAVSQNGVTSVANHRVFDSYGNLVSQTNAAVDYVFGFTGFLTDKATGLDMSESRPYEATTGRWLGPDWKGFQGGDTNLYRYVGNSPTMFVDPTGMNRWVMTNGFHWWLVVEEWDATGTRVIGYHKLEYWVWGYEMDWGPRPKNPNVGDYLDNGGWVVGEWKSNAAQDQALLDEW